METKELKIEIPKGFEIDREKSTFEKIAFKKIEKQEPKTYEEVADLSIRGRDGFYISDNDNGRVCGMWSISLSANQPHIALTKEQLEWILALNKLQNVANYLNGEWKPDWQNKCWDKHYLYYSHETLTVEVGSTRAIRYSSVYFKSAQLAQKAIEILGEGEIKKALGVYKGC